jgi:DNA polymerase-1
VERILLIDGNSILNRAFYGIMGNKMLMTEEGIYTNAVYGFLSIMFKAQEELKPEYLVVAFDKKGPTKRHELYKEYKSNRKGMPQELAVQMPIIKEILEAMNIKIMEKEGYEGDDIIGTLSTFGEKNELLVTILSGDRDNFQLATDKVTIQIPRTKAGKTQTDNYDKNKIIEEYGIEPCQLIQVKGLMGDSSDNIPGVPGIGEKTALNLIKEYNDIDNLYDKIEKGEDNLKGKIREKLIENKELAILSRELGSINIDSPIEKKLEEMKVEQWNREKVLELFKKYRFNRYIEKFDLQEKEEIVDLNKLFKITEIKEEEEIRKLISKIKKWDKIFYYLGTKSSDEKKNVIKKQIIDISIIDEKEQQVYYYNFDEKIAEFIKEFKPIIEDIKIGLCSFELAKDYILLKQIGITPRNLAFDTKIAAYILNPTISKYTLETLSAQYLNIDINSYIEEKEIKEDKIQINLFDTIEDKTKEEGKMKLNTMYAYCISKLYEKMLKKLNEDNSISLLENIEMPLVKVLADMQYNGIYVDKQELIDYGNTIKQQIEDLTKQIYELAGEEFNINSPKQLGEILFEKLSLPSVKKKKNGYSTDVDVLEKIKSEHPIIEKILEYRSLMKLNSTYVEGLLPYINEIDNKIHSYFHQTVTATGRISSTEPNLQNIPTRLELGKRIRKAFKPQQGYIFLDADYSQIELRILAHISQDKHMIEAFRKDEDIHKQAASKVLNIPIEEVTKEERSKAKAVNFGIVYGISDFGLAEQIGVTRKKAKEYIEQYLEKYNGIKNFMEEIVEEAKEKGYVETLFHRRRYIPEIKSNSYVVRQFGNRAAMNTPIQGTAADIMKIAMIEVFNKLSTNGLKSKIVLQVHDELIIETLEEEKEQVKKILQDSMENAAKLEIPLKVELSEAKNWYEAK